MPTRSGFARGWSLALCLSLLLNAISLAQETWQALVTDTDKLAGPDTEIYMDGFESPVINDQGQVLFMTTTRGDDTFTALVFHDGRQIVEVARLGGTNARSPRKAIFTEISDLNLADGGQVGFRARMTAPDSDVLEVLWAGKPDQLTPAITFGDADAPGIPGGKIVRLVESKGPLGQPFVLATGGRVVFLAEMTDTKRAEKGLSEIEQSIWSIVGVRPTLVARMTIPGRAKEPDTDLRTLGRPVVSSKGPVAFWAESVSASTAIWTEHARKTVMTASPETEPPGYDAGARLNVVGNPTVNSAGQVAFKATVQTADFRNEEAVFAVDNTARLAMVAQSGKRAPDAPGNAEFYSFEDPILSNKGHVVFAATTAAPNGTRSAGVWMGKPGAKQPQLVLMQDMPVPGIEEARFGTIEQMAVNSFGDVVLLGQMVTRKGDRLGRALFRFTENDGMQVILKEGDRVQLRDGQHDQAVSFELISSQTGGGDGRPRFLNDDGQITVYIKTTSGSGIFLSRKLRGG